MATARQILPVLSIYRKDAKSLIISHIFWNIDFFIDEKSTGVWLDVWVLFTSNGDFKNWDIEFSVFNLENYHLFSFFPILSERWFGKLSYHLITLPIYEAPWHHLSINTYSLGIGWDGTQVLHLLQLCLMQPVCCLPAAAGVSAGPPSPETADMLRMLHRGLTCRSTATRPQRRSLAEWRGCSTTWGHPLQGLLEELGVKNLPLCVHRDEHPNQLAQDLWPALLIPLGMGLGISHSTPLG